MIDMLIDSISEHLALGRRIFPLRAGTKHALETGYKTKTYTKDDLVRALKSGHSTGLGWLLGPQDLVIDVDPRTAGALGNQKKLGSRLAPTVGLVARTPCTLTGRGDGGCHYYMRFEQNVNPNTKFRTHIPDFPGLEFKTYNNTVVLAYSLHELTNKPYLPHPLSPSEPMAVPPWLYALLVKPVADDSIGPGRLYQTISADELQYLLAQLPIEDFGDNSAWLPVCMAAHYATAGSEDALDVFVDWSLGDSQYADQESTIRSRWASLDPDVNDGVTLATLNQLITNRGGRPLPPKPILLAPKSEDEVLHDLVSEIGQMDPATTQGSEIEQCIRTALDLGPLAYRTVRQALAKQLNLSSGDLGDYVARLKLQIRAENNRQKLEAQRRMATSSSKSLATELAKSVYNKVYNDYCILHATNQQFYSYLGTHWEPIKDNILTKKIFDHAPNLYPQYPKLEAKIIETIPAVKTALVAMSAIEEDVFRFVDAPAPVINCANGELWMDVESGKTDFREHRYDSYLLNCLPIDYNPGAQCPRLDAGLRKIFKQAKDPGNLIRHIWEIIGYIIQPNKNIPAYFIFHGRGENGKTQLSEILIALIGAKNILPRAISDFLGSGNAHALTSLPGKLLMIDDDADIKGQLPDSALKKLAETKMFEANPKYKDCFNFKSTASPLILTNDWPRLRDLSHGMLRKAFIVPFRHNFIDDPEREDGFAQRIIATELPGALNRAIEGHFRLRQRGRFETPIDCRIAFDEWLSVANPLVGFVNSSTQKAINGSKVDLQNLYQTYRNWCLIGGVNHPVQQTTFELSLIQLGYEITGEAQTKSVKGIEIKA